MADNGDDNNVAPRMRDSAFLAPAPFVWWPAMQARVATTSFGLVTRTDTLSNLFSHKAGNSHDAGGKRGSGYEPG